MKPFISLLIMLCVFNLQAQDWANLNRFKEANSKLAEPLEGEHRVVFMGNSITEGWPTYSPEYFKNKSFINRGIGGQTTPQMLLRFQQDVIALKPSVVVILAGINDIAENTGPITLEEIANNIEAMVVIAKEHDIEVILCSVLPANNFPWRPEIKPAKKVIQLNKLLEHCAINNNLNYVDYYSAMVDDNEGLKAHLGYDGVHPNKEGYKVMESVLNETLKSVINQNITRNLPDPLQAGWKGKKVCEVLKEDKSNAS